MNEENAKIRSLAKAFQKGSLPCDFKEQWERISTIINALGPPKRAVDGWQKNLICCAADVLEGKGAVQVAITVGELFRVHGNGANMQNTSKSPTRATRATLTPSPVV